MAKCVVLCSGGISSSVVAAQAAREYEVNLLHVDFGQQAAAVQRSAVLEITKALDGDAIEIDLPHIVGIAGLQKATAANQNAANQDQGAPSVPLITLASVPLLMSELLSAAAQVAQRIGAESVLVGSSEAANEIETESAPGRGAPHHRRDYYYLFARMIEMSVGVRNPVRLETPVGDLARDEIIKLGSRYDTPFDLAYACQTGTETACGQCPDCNARDHAFERAGFLDPAGSGVSG